MLNLPKVLSDLTTDQTSPVDPDLLEAERRGLRLAIRGRNIALIPIGLYVGIAGVWPGNLWAVSVILIFLAIGILHLKAIGTAWERGWHRYAFLTIDIAALGLVLGAVPLSTEAEIPQILAFRAYGAQYLFLVLAFAALSLSPGLVLWAGTACTVMLWTVWGLLVSQMERQVSWGDLPPGPTAEEYIAVVLNPDFIGTGNRANETIALLMTAILLAVAVHRARRLVRDRVAAERQRAKVEQTFGQYVPRAVASALVENDAILRPVTRTASIMFVDIEGFTRFSEDKPPERVVAVLNAYFDEAARTIGDHGGVIISFIGDALLVAFNLPVEIDRSAGRAVDAGNALIALTDDRRFADETIRIRVGIATGPVAAGSVGGGGRQTYTVYGDTVNLAQRLEALNKELGTRLLVCEGTQQRAQDPTLTPARTVTVKGRDAPVAIYSQRVLAAKNQPMSG